MLDLGFLPDVEKIMEHAAGEAADHAVLGDHAGPVIGLARRYMSQPTHIRATSPDDAGATVANITQHVFRAHSLDKPELVARILQADGRGLAMIFCRTKRTAADIADQLAQRGFASGAVHGDLGQGAREQALRAFRNGKVDVLVCTDVAARGIDVDGVTHVINYQSPEDEKTYLHRIGRTGRAGASGIAITLVDWDDIPRWQLINKALDLSFNDPEETYSTSAAPLRAAGHPRGHQGCAAARRADPGGPGRRGRGGPGRDRRPRPQVRRPRGRRGGADAHPHPAPAPPYPQRRPGGRGGHRQHSDRHRHRHRRAGRRAGRGRGGRVPPGTAPAPPQPYRRGGRSGGPAGRRGCGSACRRLRRGHRRRRGGQAGPPAPSQPLRFRPGCCRRRPGGVTART